MAEEAVHRNHNYDDADADDDDVDNVGRDNDNDDDYDDDVGMDLDEHRSVQQMPRTQSNLRPPTEMLLDADPDETFQPTESEEDDAIAEAIDLISELDDTDAGDKSDNNNDTSKPTIWHVRDGFGSWSDSRKIVALLNQNSGDWKLSKDRMTKIIQSFSSAGRTGGTAAYGAVEELGDVVQSVCLNSIASFCFEDATVQGGLRFWLGKVLRMVHRPKAGTKKLLTSRIALKDIPADIYLSCTWYTPILTNGATVLTANKFELLPQVVSDLTKEVDAKYIISVVDMQQEDAHYCLPEKDLAVIGAYIKETAAAFALEKSEVQPALKKDKGQKASTKRKSPASSVATVKDVEATSGAVTNTTISGSGRHITKNPKYHH